MIEHDPIPDDVPVPDAVEQIRPVTESADLESLDIGERLPVDDSTPPLESNELDWQDQRQVVEDPDPDEIR
ncbi:hypothetical protein ACQ856_00600 [Mycolicibacterium psychrotolerans]|uniref:hypothetical protein n=1 Tax=Mycolicibacterium psychrotolerans TaxID=216929 RepID=UPI003D664C4A